jgi:hypothetical protein
MSIIFISFATHIIIKKRFSRSQHLNVLSACDFSLDPGLPIFSYSKTKSGRENLSPTCFFNLSSATCLTKQWHEYGTRMHDHGCIEVLNSYLVIRPSGSEMLRFSENLDCSTA